MQQDLVIPMVPWAMEVTELTGERVLVRLCSSAVVQCFTVHDFSLPDPTLLRMGAGTAANFLGMAGGIAARSFLNQ